MTWFERFKEETRVEYKECADIADGDHIDHLQLELDTIREIRSRLKALKPSTRKRVFFYIDDLVKEGLGD